MSEFKKWLESEIVGLKSNLENDKLQLMKNVDNPNILDFANNVKLRNEKILNYSLVLKMYNKLNNV